MLDKQKLRALSRNLKANPDDCMESCRQNVRMYIDQKEITLSEIAELADLSESTVKTFLYGKGKDVHLSTIVRLAKVFNVSVDELVGAGTISPQTCESLQIMRLLPESFTHFVRWATRYHYDLLTNQTVSNKAIELMHPEEADGGNLKVNNNFTIEDISDLPKDVRPKVFMGIVIPTDSYMPKYCEGDILLIANDRKAKSNEVVVISIDNNLWFVYRKEDLVEGKKIPNLYSVRSGRLRIAESEVQHIIGYVAYVKHQI